jgi:hypothetical protein
MAPAIRHDSAVDPDKLTVPERALWKAFPRGEVVDLTQAWGVWARTVRAEVIAALLFGAVAPEPGWAAALRLHGARISGALRLGHCVLAGPVRMRECEFESVIDLSGARVRDVDLSGSRLSGLLAPRAEVDGDLTMTGCQCTGQVMLAGAHVTGALRMDEARLRNPGAVAVQANRLVVDDDLIAARAAVEGAVRLGGARVSGVVLLDGAELRSEAGPAIYARNMSVGARFLARDGFSCSGEIVLIDASIEQDLNFRGASLRNPGGSALVAWGVQVGRNLSLYRGFSVEGTIALVGASIGAELLVTDARLTDPRGRGMHWRNVQATTLALGPGLDAQATVDVRYSRFTVIRDDPACWPAALRLSGLAYDAIDPPLTAQERVRWLHRDADGYVARNYETLAGMYRGHGDDASARAVLLARERDRRAHMPWYGRPWSLLQEVAVGYGYRPLRAGAWLVAFLATGTLVFGLHHPPSLPGAPHPAFNPFIYTVDLLVPLVNLGMRTAYDPQGPQRWLAYFLIAVGWIFATTIAAGIARVLRRQ